MFGQRLKCPSAMGDLGSSGLGKDPGEGNGNPDSRALVASENHDEEPGRAELRGSQRFCEAGF